MTQFTRRVVVASGALCLAAVALAWSQLPVLGAGGLLHPARTTNRRPTPDGCREAVFDGEGVRLKGWRCAAAEPILGTIVYLHGIADNRSSAEGAVRRFLPRGFDAIAYDSRAHGDSTGEACTYGFFEKLDLRRVLDSVRPGPIVIVGTSLGA